MAKTVFGSHAQTAHVWAQGDAAPYGRASDGRMYFEGRRLFSYGSHFVLGLVIMGPDARPAVTLLNGSRYSPSTGKHQNHTWHAARGTLISVPDLTSIAGTLESLTAHPGARQTRKANRFSVVEIERHIAANWAGYTPDAAAFVLGLAGGTAKQAAALIEKARKAHERKRAAEAKAELAAHVTRAKEWAAMTSAQFRADWRAAIGTSRHYAEAESDRFIKRVRQAHKAASGAGLARVKSKVWANLKVILAEQEKARAAAEIADKNKAARNAAKVLRQYWANAAAEAPRTLEANQWRYVMESCRALEHRVHERPSLANLGNVLNALNRTATQAYDDALTAEREARDAARAERERLEKLEAEAQRAEWFAGNPAARLYEKTAGGGVYLRALHVERDGAGEVTGGTLQTSLGAEVPLAHALKAFKFLKLCRANGQEFHANGRTIPVGHFRIEHIRANGDFTAGCHFIEWEHVAALAHGLGVDGYAPDDSAVVETAHA